MDTVHRYELIYLQSHGEFYYVQYAVAGHLTEEFTVHKSIHDQYPNRSDFMRCLERTADDMLERYGDIRYNRRAA